jgi:hypothetical protein
MSRRFRQVALTVGGIAIGFIGMRFFGLNALFLVLSVAACWLAFTMLGLHQRLVLPLSFAGGHAIWFIIGIVWSFAIGTHLEAMIEISIEVLVVAALVIWVYVRHSKASLYGLIVYEVLSIGFNVFTWTLVGTMQGILVVHIAVRLVAIVGAVLALMHRAEFAPNRP